MLYLSQPAMMVSQ